MYLRHTTHKKNGKVRTYWRLVRSVRVGRRVRQETVANLGELDDEGRARASALAASMTGQTPQRGLFDDVDDFPREPIAVDLRRLRLERGRRFGDVWLGWVLWQALRLDRFCEAHLDAGREDVPWVTMAAVLSTARLCEPSSELHIAEDWYRTTALDDLLGLSEEKVNEDRLYRALDKLLPHKEALEAHLKERLGELFELKYELLLYDVTSTYFEGEAEANELAKRGYSRDKRSDCKQVCIGLVVTEEGIPLGYELFAGNRVDVTTVEEIVEAMEAKYGRAERIWVMDRGMVNEDNLAFLRERGYRYVVGTPKSELRRFREELTSGSWTTIREELEVKLCPAPDGKETFVLCRSADRKAKEEAMHQRFARRIEDGLESLGRRLAKAKIPANRSQVERQIGRLLGKNSHAAGLFKIEVAEDSTCPSGLRFRWTRNAAWSEWAALSEGTYVLRSNIEDWSAEALWKTYIQLTQAESAFRIEKGELSIRPVWHQKTSRVEAHILVCFLAYVLWKTLEQWQVRAGLGNSPRTVLDELARIQSTDVVLPAADGRELRLRCVVRPDGAQAALLARLGLVLPERLRLPAHLHAM